MWLGLPGVPVPILTKSIGVLTQGRSNLVACQVGAVIAGGIVGPVAARCARGPFDSVLVERDGPLQWSRRWFDVLLIAGGESHLLGVVASGSLTLSRSLPRHT